MSFNQLSLERLRRRRSEKWTSFGEDVLPAFYAEMDFDPAPPVVRALTQAIELGDLGYPYRGPDLGRAFAGFAGRRWGWDLDPKTVVAVPDVMVGVAELLRALTSPGAGVVINTPVYPPFFSVIAEVGRRVVEVPMAGGLPLHGIRGAFEAGAEALLLCNPHNPTGHVASREELLAVSELAAEFGRLVISDEIHAPLVLPGATHVPYGSLGRGGVTLTSTSKGWNLAGLKCGLAIADPETLRTLPEELPDRVGHLGVLATIAALEEGEDWLDELLAYLDETRRWLPGALPPEIGYSPGAATYLAWLDCRALGLGDDPAGVFLERGRVALARGPEFGAPGFARLNFGTSRALVAEAVNRMARAVA